MDARHPLLVAATAALMLAAGFAPALAQSTGDETRQGAVTVDSSITPASLQPGGAVALEASITLDGDVNGPAIELVPPAEWTITETSAGEAFEKTTDDGRQFVWLAQGEPGETVTKTVDADLSVPADAESGEYGVTVTGSAIDADSGQRLTDETTVEVALETAGQAPRPVVTLDPAAPTTDEPVALDGAASSDPDGSIQAYQWAVDGATVGHGETIEHTFSSAGEHTVRLTVEDDEGRTATTVDTVTVDAPEASPTARISVTPSEIQTGDAVTLDATASEDPDGSITSYAWMIDGEPISQGPTAEHRFETPGDHRIELTVTDDDGANASATRVVTVAPSSTGTIALDLERVDNDDGVQTGEQITLEGTVAAEGLNAPALDVDVPEGWSVTPVEADDARFRDSEHQLLWTQPGTKQVTLHVEVPVEVADGTTEQIVATATGIEPATGDRVQTRQTFDVMHDADDPPAPIISLTPEEPATGETVTLDASGSQDPDGEITAYRWRIDGTPAGQGATVEHVFETAVEHTISLTVTDDAGQQASVQRVVEVLPSNQAPSTRVSVQPSVPHVGDAVRLDASGSSDPDGAIAAYTWRIDGTEEGTGPTLSTTFDEPGVHTIELVVRDDEGALRTAVEKLPVPRPPQGQLSLDLDITGDGTLEPGDATQVTVSLDPGDAVAPHVSLDAPAGWTLAPVDDAGAAFHADDDEWVWARPTPKAITARLEAPSDATPGTAEIEAEGSGLSPITGDRFSIDASGSLAVIAPETDDGPGPVAVLADPGEPEPGKPVSVSLPSSFDADAETQILWTSDGREIGTGPSTTYTPDHPGEDRITVKVTTPGGDEATARRTLEIRDRTEPNVDLAASASTVEAGDPVRITATADDDRGLDRVELTRLTDDGPEELVTRTIDGDGTVDLTHSLDGLDYGDHEIRATATDGAGNVETATLTVFAQQVHEAKQRVERGSSETVVEQEGAAAIEVTATRAEDADVEMTTVVSEGDAAKQAQPTDDGSDGSDGGSSGGDGSAPDPPASSQGVRILRSVNVEEGGGHDADSVDRVRVTLEYTEDELEGLDPDELGVHYWTGNSWVNTLDVVGETIPDGGPHVYDAGVLEDEQRAFAVVDHTSSYGVGGPADAVPPTISQLSPQGDVNDPSPTVSVDIFEDGSGLDADETTLSVDGEVVVGDLDGGTLTYTPTGLDQRTHRATVTATDEAGNTASETWTFRVEAPTSATPGGGAAVDWHDPDTDDETPADRSSSEDGPPTATPLEDPHLLDDVGDDEALDEFGVDDGSGQARAVLAPLPPEDARIERLELRVAGAGEVDVSTVQSNQHIDEPRPALPPGFTIPAVWSQIDLEASEDLTVQETGLRFGIPAERLWDQPPETGVLLQADGDRWTPVPTTLQASGSDRLVYDAVATNVGAFAFAIDQAPPRAELASPAPGETIPADGGKLEIDWSDNRGIDLAATTVRIDGERQDAWMRADGVDLETDALEPGAHTVTLRLVDESGHEREERWSVTVAR